MTKTLAKKHGVCDLEYAIELKDLGYKQEGHFWWASHDGENYILTCNQIGFRFEEWKLCPKIVAPTVAELGERLPYPNFTRKYYNLWHGFINPTDNQICDEEFIANTEANARAKMKIYLLKNKLTKP